MRDTRYRYVALGVLLLLVLAAAVRHGWNMFFENPTGEIQSNSFSSLEAAKRGTLVCRLDVKPKEFLWKGTRIRFDEAWLEERFLETHFLAWFPWDKRGGRFQLVFHAGSGSKSLRPGAGVAMVRP